VLAVETSIRLWTQSPPLHHRLAIRSYPEALEEDFALKTGPLAQLRPIRPEDEPEHAVFFSRLRPEDIQLRFFGSLSKFHHPVLARFTQIDYDREMAFIATAPDADGKPETLGEVRTIADPDNLVAEYSIIIRSDLGSG